MKGEVYLELIRVHSLYYSPRGMEDYRENAVRTMLFVLNVLLHAAVGHIGEQWGHHHHLHNQGEFLQHSHNLAYPFASSEK